MIYNKMYLFLKVCQFSLTQCFMCMEKELPCFMGDKLVPDVIFIFKIQIKGAFCNTCLISDIRNCGFGKPFCGKKLKGSVKKGIFFLFLIYF